MANEHGLDVQYFKEKLSQLVLDVERYTPGELNRELAALAKAAMSRGAAVQHALRAHPGGGFSIDGTHINENIWRELGAVVYEPVERNEMIDDLARWIGEREDSCERTMMMDDLMMLRSIDDDIVFSSGVTNDYVVASRRPEKFDEICRSLLDEQAKLDSLSDIDQSSAAVADTVPGVKR